jgi:hypothetical protein
MIHLIQELFGQTLRNGAQGLIMKKLATSTDASDLSIKLHVGGIAGDATRIGLSRRVMIGRRAFGMMLRGLACEGRRRCHKYHDRDRDQRSHFNPHFTRRFSTACMPRYQGRRRLRPPGSCGTSVEGKVVSPRRNLLWRAKLADKPRHGPCQLQRINPIAFPAAERPAPCRLPASPAPSRRYSARTAQMYRTASHCNSYAAPVVTSNLISVNGKQFPSRNREMLGDMRDRGARHRSCSHLLEHLNKT